MPQMIDNILPLISALCTLAKHMGVNIEPQVLQSYSSSTQEIFQVLARLGLPTRTLQKKIEDILPQTLPCVLILNPAHEHEPNRACLVLEILDSKAKVIFTENSPISSEITFEDLKPLYTGLTVFPSLAEIPQTEIPTVDQEKNKSWFWKIFFHYLPIYKDVFIASIIINLLVLASPLFVMNVYDRVIPNNAMDTLWILAIGVCLAYSIDFILKLLRSHFIDLAGRNADVVLSSGIMDKMLHLKLSAQSDSTGALVNNVREFEQLREFIGSTTLIALIDLPFVFLFIALIAWLGGPLAFLPLMAVPLMILLGTLFQSPFKRSADKQFAQNSQKNALLVEIVSGMETIKTNLLQNTMLNRFERIVDANANTYTHSKKLSSIAVQSVNLISMFINTALIIWGAYRIAQGQMSMGALVACVILLGRTMGSLAQIASLINNWQKARTSLKNLNNFMNLQSEDEETENNKTKGLSHTYLPASFTLEEVAFTYPNSDIPALKNISLTIKEHEKVGIMGLTGSGKSTLAKLLLNLYTPQQGRITFGNVDLKHIHTALLRSRIGYLSQDNLLFQGTVLENITMGCLGVSEHHILQASILAGVHHFIQKNPAGYAMQVGEKGNTLSGGQKQAIALARALIRDPDVLILDEPSSNLDMTSERALIQRASQAFQNKTLILFTHRPSMLELVNRLIVIENGKIVADGARDFILKKISQPITPPTLFNSPKNSVTEVNHV